MPTTMIKNASKVILRQLNLPQQHGGHLVLGGGHPESLQTLPQVLSSWLERLMKFYPSSSQHAEKLPREANSPAPPVEINGASSAHWQQKEIYKANKHAEKLEIFV